MSSDAKQKRDKALDDAARELRRIEQAVPVFIENAHFIAGKPGGHGFVLLESNPGMKDRRGPILRWLVPARHVARRIRLDAFGTFVAQRITGRMSSSDIIKAFQEEFGCAADQSREACLLFLRSLAKRGVILMVEKDK